MGDAVWKTLVVILTAAAVVQGVLLIAVMRQLGGVLIQIRPGRIGEVEYDEGPAVGSEVELPGRLSDRPALVLFVAPSCGVCRPLLPAIPVVAKQFPELDVVAAIIGGAEEERLRFAREIGEFGRPDLHELQATWNIPGTPFVVAVDREGKVRDRGIVNSLDQLESLAESVLMAPIEAQEVIEAVSSDPFPDGDGKGSLALTPTGPHVEVHDAD